jgi:phosphate acetyltransferase
MKGSLHTDELMAEVVKRDAGLRTARRLSHCFIMDVPGHGEPLIITDAAVNIAPTLSEKADIVQNAIDLLRDLGASEVRVAILSAMETVNPDVPSTLEAAALCKMADRGQITGALVDGPLALDNAIDLEAARIKHISSLVAGRANVLVVPDLEAGNMLAKSLTFLAGQIPRASSSGPRCQSSSPAGPTRASRGSPPAPWRACSPRQGGPVRGGRWAEPCLTRSWSSTPARPA